MKKILSVLSVKHIVIISINVFCLIAFFVCISLSDSLKTPLRSQQAASAWAGQSGERFAQLSVFIPESEVFNDERIFSLRSDLDRALLGVSLESGSGRTLYTDAWSAYGEVSVMSERALTSASVIGVGGDFFLFHPLYLRDGSYLLPNDLMKNRIVLDEELAWRLYGSVQLAGFDVFINDKPFIIAGVLARETDYASSRAYTGGAGMFMSFEALTELTDGMARITCYEIVMPDPITGFALDALTNALADSNVHIVENSARFSLANLFTIISSFGERSMRRDVMVYPYWENAARLTEDLLALLLLFTLLFAVPPIVFCVIYCVKIIQFFIKRGKKTIRKVIDNRDKRQYEKYLSEHEDEPQIYNVNDIIREVQDEIH